MLDGLRVGLEQRRRFPSQIPGRGLLPRRFGGGGRSGGGSEGGRSRGRGTETWRQWGFRLCLCDCGMAIIVGSSIRIVLRSSSSRSRMMMHLVDLGEFRMRLRRMFARGLITAKETAQTTHGRLALNRRLLQRDSLVGLVIRMRSRAVVCDGRAKSWSRMVIIWSTEVGFQWC